MLNWNFGIAAVNWRAMFCSSHRRHRTCMRAGDTSCFLDTAKRLLGRAGRPRLDLSQLFLFASFTAFASDAAAAQMVSASQIKPNPVVTTANSKCPSQNFTAFFQAFAESSDLQWKYTRVPFRHTFLEFVSPYEDPALKEEKITAFEKIPQFQLTDSGAIFIFPNNAHREKYALKFEITTKANSKKEERDAPELVIRNSNAAAVFLSKDDSDSTLVSFLFRRAQGCWFLYGMVDRSL